MANKLPVSIRMRRAYDVLRGRRHGLNDQEIFAASKLMRSMAMNSYDAAKSGRLREDWGTNTDVPYYDLCTAQRKIRARSRELYKNDPTYRGAIKAIINHVVGRGLRPKPRVRDYDNNPNDIINAELERASQRYLETRDWDAGGRLCFVGEGQRLALKTQLLSGDVIFNAVKAKPGKYLPVAWQMVEIDRLDNTKDNFKRTFEYSDQIKQTVHGINLDEYGAAISYNFKGIDNPVSAKNIIHSYLQERPEQYVGEPLGTAILDSVYDKHDLDEDYVLKSRAVAKFLWWLSTLSDKWPYNGDQDSSGNIPIDSLTQMRSETNPDIFKMPDNVSTTIEPLLRMKKHDVCSGMGISYITVLLDMSGVNFAAASMNNIKEQLNFGVLRQMFIESLCQPFWDKFVLNLVVSGSLTGVSAERFALDPYHYTRCEWANDPIGHADPTKISNAKISDIEAKRESLTSDLASRGIDIRDHVKTLQKEKELFAEAGIEYPPQKNTVKAPADPNANPDDPNIDPNADQEGGDGTSTDEIYIPILAGEQNARK